MEFLASLHPKMVHFAIALLSIYVLFEILYAIFKKDIFNQTAMYLLLFGILGAVASLLTGNQAYHYAEYLFDNYDVKIPLGLMEEHEEFAKITTFWFIGLLIIRFFLNIKNKLNGYLHILVLFFAIVGMYFIYETGEHGGKLVYEHGVGTKLIEKDIPKPIQPNVLDKEKFDEDD